MGKRRPVVVIPSSSSDEDAEARGASRSRSRSASAFRKRLCGGRSSKKADGGSSGVRPFSEVEAANFDMLSEDFCECFIMPVRKLGSGFEPANLKEMWVDKYKPQSLAELAVHKKKVEEVKNWLEERVLTLKEDFDNCTLLITGQAGVGKSTVIHVIASHLGADICEWKTPTPTLWQEHIHNINSGMHYISKLDEFEVFVEKTRKYPLLGPTYTGGSKKPVILLIDDLPVTNGRVSFVRLSKCLTALACSTKVPTVILITEYYKTEPVNSMKQYREELECCLESAGAHKVAFNPVTVNSIKKILSRICQEEKCDVTAECIDQIAKASGGDMRHAITSLQYFCLRPDICSLPVSHQTSTHLNINLDETNSLSSSVIPGVDDHNIMSAMPFGRDETLTLFHALGKFLHNKRESIYAFPHGSDSLILQEKFSRKALKMDAPEKVLSQAHGQARPIADFLHENVLDFISDEGIDDASCVTSYLCDADCLLAGASRPTWHQIMTVMYESESIAQSVSASVAVRGVLFGNSQPSPSRWHTIRSPRLWQVEQLSRRNKVEMERSIADNNSLMSQIEMEYGSTIKWLLEFQNSKFRHAPKEQFLQYAEGEGDVDSDLMGNISTEEVEDEIEDW